MLDSAPNQQPNRELDKRNPPDPFEGLQFKKYAIWGAGGIGFLVFASIVANYVKRSVTELMDKHEPTGVYLRGNASVESVKRDNKDKVSPEDLKNTPVRLPPSPEVLEN